MFNLFESQFRKEKDKGEIEALVREFGPNALSLAREWAKNPSLSKRSRKHWKRIAYKLGHHRHHARKTREAELSVAS